MTQRVQVLLLCPFLSIVAGCDGELPEQRQSGTLVVPLESVERAGEESARQEDAKKKAPRAVPKSQ